MVSSPACPVCPAPVITFSPFVLCFHLPLFARLESRRLALDADRLEDAKLLARGDKRAWNLGVPVDLLCLLVVVHK